MIDGVAFVDCKYPDRSVPMDQLRHCADTLGGLGAGAWKWYWTGAYASSYPQQSWDGAHTNLTELLGDSSFQYVINNAPSVVILNTWTFANGINNKWINDWSKADGEAEEAELYDACCALLALDDGRTYVIQNWEGDWALLGSFNVKAPITKDRANRFCAYMLARKRAILRARNDVPSSTKLVFACEVNRCLDLAGFRVHRLLKRIKPEAVSFSLYECINGLLSGNQAGSEAQIERRMRRAAFNVRRELNYPVILYVGEYGQNERETSFIGLSLDAAALTAKVRSVADALGFAYCAFWQLFDNEVSASPGPYRGYAVFDENGDPTIQGAYLLSVW